jgi:hypothetical protein
MARKSVYIPGGEAGKSAIVRWYALESDGRHRHLARKWDSLEEARRFERRLKAALSGEAMPAAEVFWQIRRAVEAGRPIVPLVGPGLGGNRIPRRNTLELYFRQLSAKIARDRESGEGDSILSWQWLRQRGWPDWHELYAESLAEPESERPQRRGASRAWTESFQLLTAGEGAPQWVTEELATSFRRKVLGEAAPATAHRHLAYLAASLDCPLILNAAPNDFVYDAVREAGLRATRLDFDSGGFPPRPDEFDLGAGIRDRLKIVNLSERGADPFLFGPRPLPAGALAVLRRYVPDDALVLVIGEDGRDVRIRAVIAELAKRKPSGPDVDLLWVLRKSPSPEARSTAAAGVLAFAQAADEGLFLLETICRLFSIFPPERVSFDAALPMAPQMPLRKDSTRRGGSAEDQASGAESSAGEESAGAKTTAVGIRSLDDVREPIIAAKDAEDDKGRRTKHAFQLASCSRILTKNHVPILVDAEESETAECLLWQIWQQLSRYDPGLPPLILSELQPLTGGPESRLETHVRRLVGAMRRGRYVIMIDALASFASSHLDDRKGSGKPWKAWEGMCTEEAESLKTFLRMLMERCREFGDSKLFIASTRSKSDGEWAQRLVDGVEAMLPKNDQGEQDPPRVRWLTSDELPEDKLDAEAIKLRRGEAEQIGDAVEENLLAQVVADVDPDSPTKLPGQSIYDRYDRWEELLPEDARVVLAIASGFRKPRNIVLLRKCVATLWTQWEEAGGAKSQDPPTLQQLKSLLSDDSYREIGSTIYEFRSEDAARFDRADRSLELLDLLSFLTRQDGGYFWMPRKIRNTIYDEQWKAESNRDVVANFHDLAAAAYYEAFRPSGDMAVFLEYVVHRAASARHSDPAKIIERLRLLTAGLERQRDALIAEGYAGTVVRRLVRLKLLDLPEMEKRCRAKLSDEFRRVVAEICDTEAEFRLAVTDFRGCIELRLRQIDDRLQEIDELSRKSAAEREDSGRTSRASHFAAWRKEWPTYIRRAAASEKSPEGSDMPGPLKDSLLRALPDAIAGIDSTPDRERADELFRRLLSHLHRIGLCLHGLRRFDGADALLAEVRAAASGFSDRLPESSLGRRMRRWSLRMEADCRLHHMRIQLDQIPLWPNSDPSTVSPAKRLEQAEGHYAGGQRTLEDLLTGETELDMESGSNRALYFNYRCRFSTLRCRLSALRAAHMQADAEVRAREFDVARKYCELAQSVVWRQLGRTAGAMAAVCRLTEAELLILRGDFESTNKQAGRDGDVAVATGSRRLHVALDLLQEAETLLRRAPQNVRWWTWLFALRAQVLHDLLIGSFDATDGARTGSWRESLISGGLLAIGYGLDNVAKDYVRRKTLVTLLWQFYVCKFFLIARRPASPRRGRPRQSERPAERLQTEWNHLLEEAQLDWYDRRAGRAPSGGSARGSLRDEVTQLLAGRRDSADAITRATLIDAERAVYAKYSNQFGS